MSEDQLKALLAAMENDPALESHIKDSASYEDVIAKAKASGFEIEIADLLASDSELSDRELQDVSGGLRLALDSKYECCGCKTNFSLNP